MKCPCCNGEGGIVEACLDYNQGPYYPCGYCEDKLKVNFFKWLWWKYQGFQCDRIEKKLNKLKEYT